MGLGRSLNEEGHMTETTGSDVIGAANGTLPDGAEQKDKAPAHTPEEERLFEKFRQYLCARYGLDESWPATRQPDEKKPETGTDSVTPMSDDAAAVAYQQQIEELTARLVGLELERDQERCSTLFYALEAEGFRFSDDEKKKELAKLVKISAAERQDRVTELRAIYAGRKVPEGRLDLYRGKVEPDGSGDERSPFARPWYYEQAVAYMMANPGTTYDAAVEHAKKTAASK
jgi:hypothetical protein